jgi:hypothetical protein
VIPDHTLKKAAIEQFLTGGLTLEAIQYQVGSHFHALTDTCTEQHSTSTCHVGWGGVDAHRYKQKLRHTQSGSARTAAGPAQCLASTGDQVLQATVPLNGNTARTVCCSCCMCCLAPNPGPHLLSMC